MISKKAYIILQFCYCFITNFWYKRLGNKIGDNPTTRKHGLNLTRTKIVSEMRHNPNITKAELVILLGISNTAVDNNIRYLRENGYIFS